MSPRNRHSPAGTDCPATPVARWLVTGVVLLVVGSSLFTGSALATSQPADAPGPVTVKTCHLGGGHVVADPKNSGHRSCRGGRWSERDIQG
jgi:hypothetical protein